MDSLLERLLSDNQWKSKRYRAHNEDYSQILWPEKFSKERLIEIRQGYLNQGNPEGYAQEYLNYPIDDATAFFQREDMLPMRQIDHESNKIYYVGTDLAVSTRERSDYSVILVAGADSHGMLHIVDVRRGRWDSMQIIDELFSVQKRYDPQSVVIERGTIEKSLGPILDSEMMKRGLFIPFFQKNNQRGIPVTSDKKTRAQGIRARMRAGGVRFDKESSWYADFEDEVLRFDKGKWDDQVDSLSLLGLALNDIMEAPTEQETADEEYEMMKQSAPQGRSAVCGY
jgi:predicted phage terminase large subunit-like protein